MGTIKRKFHLPTINFQGYVSFGGNKWFFLYHSWLYSPSLWWLQKLCCVPAKPAVKISPQVAPTYPVHNVADLAVPKKKGGGKNPRFSCWTKIGADKKKPSTGYMPRIGVSTHKGQVYQFPHNLWPKVGKFIFLSEAPYDWYQVNGFKMMYSSTDFIGVFFLREKMFV